MNSSTIYYDLEDSLADVVEGEVSHFDYTNYQYCFDQSLHARSGLWIADRNTPDMFHPINDDAVWRELIKKILSEMNDQQQDRQGHPYRNSSKHSKINLLMVAYVHKKKISKKRQQESSIRTNANSPSKKVKNISISSIKELSVDFFSPLVLQSKNGIDKMKPISNEFGTIKFNMGGYINNGNESDIEVR